jgi:hypothetical protein
MRRAFDIDVLAGPRCGGRLRLIATVEDPEAIRAILAAMAISRERADRAPPFAALLDPSLAATISASARSGHPGMPRAVHARPEPSCLAVNQLLTPLGIPLTGPLSALYLGGGPP